MENVWGKIVEYCKDPSVQLSVRKSQNKPKMILPNEDTKALMGLVKTQVDERGRPYLHLLSFTNLLLVFGWRRQPHVAEGQLSLWLPATRRRGQRQNKNTSAYQQALETE